MVNLIHGDDFFDKNVDYSMKSQNNIAGCEYLQVTAKLRGI
jgi:hypothetical protein